MNYASVQQGLEWVRSYLRPYLQVDLSYTTSQEQVVGWRGYVGGVDRNVYYPLEYQYLLDHGQYSFLLSDASFLQMYYRFGEDGLEMARLAYYPAPIRLKATSGDFLDAAERSLERGDDQMFDHLYNWYETIDERRDMPLNVSHLRFDFDKRAQGHAPSHLQFGAIQELRISAEFFPQPIAFVELIRPCLELDAQPIGMDALRHAANNQCQLVERPDSICLRRFPRRA